MGSNCLTVSRLASDNSLTGSAEENARWLTLIRGMMSCLERTSAETLGPREYVSHLHLNWSLPNSMARSCSELHQNIRCDMESERKGVDARRLGKARHRKRGRTCLPCCGRPSAASAAAIAIHSLCFLPLGHWIARGCIPSSDVRMRFPIELT